MFRPVNRIGALESALKDELNFESARHEIFSVGSHDTAAAVAAITFQG